MCECEKIKERVFDERSGLWYWKYYCHCFNHFVFYLIPGQIISEAKSSNNIPAVKPEAGPVTLKVP